MDFKKILKKPQIIAVIVILLAVAIYLTYHAYTSSETFFFTLFPTVATSDPTSLIPNVYYTVGVRKTSNTTTPAQNGGTNCTEFPPNIYYPAAVVNAICAMPSYTPTSLASTVDNVYYTMDGVTVLGNTYNKLFLSPAFPAGSVGPYTCITVSGNQALLSGPGNNPLLYFCGNYIASTSPLPSAPQFTSYQGLSKVTAMTIASPRNIGFHIGTDNRGNYTNPVFANNGWSRDGSTDDISLAIAEPASGAVIPININSSKMMYSQEFGNNFNKQTAASTLGFVQVSADLGNVAAITAAGALYLCQNPQANDGMIFNQVVSSVTIKFKYVSIGGDGVCIGILKEDLQLTPASIAPKDTMIACRNVLVSTSLSDWKRVRPNTSNPNTWTFQQVNYKSKNQTMSAIDGVGVLLIEGNMASFLSYLSA